MKGERSFFFLLFFFLLLALVIAALRHFPLMLAPRYTRCCRLALLRGRGMPAARPPRHGEGIWGITSLHGSAWSTSRASSSRFALRLVPCRLGSYPGGLFSPCMVPFRVLPITHPHAAPSSAAGARTPDVPRSSTGPLFLSNQLKIQHLVPCTSPGCDRERPQSCCMDRRSLAPAVSPRASPRAAA